MESTSGMVLRMQLLQALPGHVRVNRRRRYVCMPEQHLHGTQVCTVVKQMCGKRMPQCMRRQRHMNICQQRVFFDQHPKHHTAHGHAALGHKHRRAVFVS